MKRTVPALLIITCKIHNTPLGRKQVLDINMQLHTLPFPSPLRIENN